MRPPAARPRGDQRRVSRALGTVLAALAAMGSMVVPATAVAQESATCLMCHANPSMFAGQDNPSRYVVSEETHAGSAHGAAGLECTTCHMGLEFPHPEDRLIVDCAMCHPTQGRQHTASLHGQAAARGDPLAPSCRNCHGTHSVLPDTDPRAPTRVMNIPMLCGECHREGSPVSRTHTIHQDSILQNYSLSIHGAGLFRQGLTVTAVCTSCHTSHQILPHTDPQSSIHRDNVATTCTQCHAQIEQVHRQVIEGRLWEEEPDKIPACVDCHSPHEIRNVLYEAGSANRDCLSCHGDPELTGIAQGETVSLFVDEQIYNASDHSGTACAQCHTEVTSSLRRPCETVTSNVDCAVCHAGPVELYDSSSHGRLAEEGDEDAPTCQDCHTKHGELNQRLPVSPTFPSNIPELCGRCHQEGAAAAQRVAGDYQDVVQSYEMSIHGQGLIESGLVVTATCTSCHTAHGELPHDDPRSSIHNDNVAETCGECHHGIEEEFRTSIHWPGVGAGEDPEADLPACNDCHTSHTISRTDREDFRLLMMDQCGVCHLEEAETFFDTFHGKVSRLGDAAAAKCYDCHGTHGILPPTEPASLLSRRNIVETCAQCHPGANRRFTGYLTHATHHDQAKYPFLFWAFWGMTTLLVGTLSFATLHTMAWLWRLWRSPEHRIRHTHAPGAKQYQRFTLFQRILHLLMLLSFFVLALTGMVLKFAHMGWAQLWADVLGGFQVTSVLHRLGAVVLLGVFAVHLWDVRNQKVESGQSWWGFIFARHTMMFTKKDLQEIIGALKWFAGRGPRPQYGRFTYWEKFDYFAVFWGMFIIGSTGLILWFPEIFTIIFPGWWVNVATILHSDEALLAVAFIFTVHFYNTHFRPDKFPMDTVIFTGRVPVDELEADKPAEFEEMLSDGTLEEKLVYPFPRHLERLARYFGFFALAVGLTLIALIVYSMLFGYQ